jgi:hypothetical protein
VTKVPTAGSVGVLQSSKTSPQLDDVVGDIDVDAIYRKIYAGHEWEGPDKPITPLQRTVGSSLHQLAEGLYSAENHFLMELIQNVDDSFFPPDVVPSLAITLHEEALSFKSNEVIISFCLACSALSCFVPY